MSRIITVAYFVGSGGIIKPENNDGDRITDSTGYIPPARQIKEFLNAGILLDRSREREAIYEYPSDVDIDDVSLDPTRRKSFDAIDSQRIAEQLAYKLSVIEKAQKAKEPIEKHLEHGELIPKNAETAEAAPKE